jgi:hypothetical protein
MPFSVAAAKDFTSPNILLDCDLVDVDCVFGCEELLFFDVKKLPNMVLIYK